MYENRLIITGVSSLQTVAFMDCSANADKVRLRVHTGIVYKIIQWPYLLSEGLTIAMREMAMKPTSVDTFAFN